MLRCNTALGLATVVGEEVSNGGKAIVRVALDSNGSERAFLREFVTESKTPVPPAAKTNKPARKPRKKKAEVEPISDELLVTPDPPPAIQLDPLDIDEPPEELKHEPERAYDSEALYG